MCGYLAGVGAQVPQTSGAVQRGTHKAVIQRGHAQGGHPAQKNQPKGRVNELVVLHLDLGDPTRRQNGYSLVTVTLEEPQVRIVVQGKVSQSVCREVRGGGGEVV